jgi:fructose-1,6-bisphosphatase/inositol monophosphatase family enzyme
MALNPLEQRVLEDFRMGRAPGGGPDDDEAWVAFLLRCTLDVVRQVRAAAGERVVRQMKDDGSPTIPLERDIEARIREALQDFAPGAAFVGEESGGEMDPDGWTVVVDPIDGTWAYLGHTETFSTVLTVFREGRPYAGAVGSPRLGEIGYCVAGGRTRLVRLDLVGEGDVADDLPVGDDDPPTLLVNAHPARARSREMQSLLGAWSGNEIQTVRSPGGSPSWSLLDAARGHFTYVNHWSTRGARPWDLAAGTLLVRGAGGDVVDLDGRPIDPVGHTGPFVADVRGERRDAVVRILKRARFS